MDLLYAQSREVKMKDFDIAVMTSIKPKYCELIVSGEKTLEIRKSKPKLQTPFKCYVYCTKSGSSIYGDEKQYVTDYSSLLNEDASKAFEKTTNLHKWNGKVIGEFICDCIIPISITYSDPNNSIAQKEFPHTCLTDKEIMEYLGNGNQGYGWHISNLAIYNEPKELSEFTYIICPEYEKSAFTAKCRKCKHFYINNIDMAFECDCDGEKKLIRPPQSWYYVEPYI